MVDRDKAPDYLQETFDMLECAFPDGVPEEEYWPLMAILHAEMSFWTIADILPLFTSKDRTLVYNDASGFGGAAPPDPPDDESIEKVKQKLLPCGYEKWLETD